MTLLPRAPFVLFFNVEQCDGLPFFDEVDASFFLRSGVSGPVSSEWLNNATIPQSLCLKVAALFFFSMQALFPPQNGKETLCCTLETSVPLPLVLHVFFSRWKIATLLPYPLDIPAVLVHPRNAQRAFLFSSLSTLPFFFFFFALQLNCLVIGGLFPFATIILSLFARRFRVPDSQRVSHRLPVWEMLRCYPSQVHHSWNERNSFFIATVVSCLCSPLHEDFFRKKAFSLIRDNAF